MYSKIIKALMKRIEALPKVLVVMYLKRAYNLSNNMANQAIFAACRDRACYDKGDYITRLPFIEMDSNLMKKGKAFRVALEFLPDSKDFVCAQYPWTLAFNRGANYVQVCYIPKDAETASSRLIAQEPVPLEDRPQMKRIAVVEPGCDLERIKRAGFAFFCTVDDNGNLKIIGKVSPKTAWLDVSEKS